MTLKDRRQQEGSGSGERSSVKVWLMVEGAMQYANATGHPPYRREAEHMMDAYSPAARRRHGWIEEVPDGETSAHAAASDGAEGRKLLQGIAPARQRAQVKAKDRAGETRVNLIFSMP